MPDDREEHGADPDESVVRGASDLPYYPPEVKKLLQKHLAEVEECKPTVKERKPTVRDILAPLGERGRPPVFVESPLSFEVSGPRCRPEGVAAEREVANTYIDFVFTGPPGPDPKDCGFVEVEDSQRRSIRVGEWVERDDGYWALRIALDGEAA